MFVTRLSIAFAVALADLPTPDPAPDAARDKADEILRDGQFHSGSSKSVMQRIVDWILDQIRLPFSDAAGGNTVVGFVILIVFLVALGYVVSRIRLRLPTLAHSEDAVLDIEIEPDDSIEDETLALYQQLLDTRRQATGD